MDYSHTVKKIFLVETKPPYVQSALPVVTISTETIAGYEMKYISKLDYKVGQNLCSAVSIISSNHIFKVNVIYHYKKSE